ncbi:MAG: NAD(P)/FAD-dependent oxidoreductase [Halioglobus sp.]
MLKLVLNSITIGDDFPLQQYDTIIIGAGHNGLVCAAYLARRGQTVLVLEASETLGGLASTREFHPGFKASVAHTLNQFSPKIAAELKLARHGYANAGEPLATVGLGLDGNHVQVHKGAITGVSEADAEKYSEYIGLLERCAGALEPSWLKTMPRIGNNSLKELLTFAQVGLKLRLLGKKDMREFLRIAALPARDLMDENFDSDLLKAALSWDGLVGSRQAPRSPNNTVLTMLYRMAGENNGAHSIPEGGMESLINALAAAATGAGAQLRMGAAVEKILLTADEDGLSATGVKLVDGSELSAKRVVSAADPKTTFLNLVGVENLEIEFSNRINRLRSDGFVAKLHLALNGMPEFTGLDKPGGRMILAPTMDAIEFAWDDAKYGQCSEHPVMEVLVPSMVDASLAPAGQHVLSANVMYIPATPTGGWDEDKRQALCEKLVDTLCQYAPGLREQILHAQLLTPDDLERDWRVTGGHWHHTEFAMDQLLMMRPTYEAAQYSTPIPGLYLCGAGCHPGGGVMGGAGHNAAHEILK